MRLDEQKIFATTKEDLRQVTCRRPCGDLTTGACASEGTENSGYFHWSSTLTRKKDDLRWLRPDGETQVTIRVRSSKVTLSD